MKIKSEIVEKINEMGNTSKMENNILDKYNKKIEKLDKTIIDDLLEYIYISKDKNIRIVFKYVNEYNSTIDFIKKHKCDIIEKNCIKNKYKEVV